MIFHSPLVFQIDLGRYSTWRHHSIPDCLLAIEMLWNGCQSHVTYWVCCNCLFWHFEYVSLALLAESILTKHETNKRKMPVIHRETRPSCIVYASLCAPRTIRFFFYSLSVLGEQSLSRRSLPGFHLKIHSCQTS